MCIRDRINPLLTLRFRIGVFDVPLRILGGIPSGRAWIHHPYLRDLAVRAAVPTDEGPACMHVELVEHGHQSALPWRHWIGNSILSDDEVRAAVVDENVLGTYEVVVIRENGEVV